MVHRLIPAIVACVAVGASGESGSLADRDEVLEISFVAQATYADPYNEVDVDVTVTGPAGAPLVVPAFWAGGNAWSVRIANVGPGTYSFAASSNHAEDAGLHGVHATIKVEAAEAIHRRLRVSADKRYFECADGTPFFWLGDTWWMGLSSRLSLDDFKELASDRVSKGFNVVQIVMGPYPDMDAFDPRGANGAGHPFTADFASINPAYYDEADSKIAVLLESNLTPCMVGMWGYYLPRLGVEKVQRYWRYLIARYGAYPVVWCAAGEGAMPYYLSENKEAEREQQRAGWTEVMRYIQENDPYDNLLTIHPVRYGRDQVLDPAVLDFEMLQTGHGDIDSVSNVIEWVREARQREPIMPVVNGEVNYEGILGRSWQNIQRLDFYHSVMNGAAGYTYGANGIWQVNTDEKPYGPSPHGRAWGNTPWREASQLPGSRQVGLGAGLFRELLGFKLERRGDLIAAPEDTKPYTPVAMGIRGKFYVIYVPMCWDAPKVLGLERDVEYSGFYFDPVQGTEHEFGNVTPNEQGEWQPPLPPEVHDWVLVVNARKE